jgi:hypothetical protein
MLGMMGLRIHMVKVGCCFINSVDRTFAIRIVRMRKHGDQERSKYLRERTRFPGELTSVAVTFAINVRAGAAAAFFFGRQGIFLGTI